ncbi:MAG: 23S rRNA (guanosine(2251)-2'-O)-methyltransferase RlmB [Spirochaetaceae bacterium]|jgi:23S rRNA (guanosine2251-2'-O)-methyltransferase|nr:23S rRNA (guanosine(2251)-2'-O)-methyltransferase RlmB [Spirochaetaceae bacterium]
MAYITGFHAIEERIKAGRARGPLLVAKAGPRAREIAALAVGQGIRTDRTGTAELDRLAPGHRGIALEVDDALDAGVETGGLEGFLESLGNKKNALVVVLDEVTDPHNYGAILRSCDQFGADLVVTRNRRAAKNADVVERTSVGASSWVKSAEVANLPRAMELLKDADFWVYGADMSGEPIYSKNLRGRVAVILGAEGSGLSRLLKSSCDGIISIPSKGRIDSLNVSVAAGVILYEIVRQRA